MEKTDITEQLIERLDRLIIALERHVSVPTYAAVSYSFHDWLDEWIRTYKTPTVKPNTLYMLKSAIRCHIKPRLPDVPLAMITGLDLQRALTAIMASRTRKAVFDVLHASFRTAGELKLITESPMNGVRIPVHRRKQGTALTPEEVTDFLTKVKGHPLESYFRFLLYTGARRTEALNTCRSDITADRIHIRGTKTDNADRTIPLFENVRSLMANLTPRKDGRLFLFRPDYVTRVFKRFCPAHKLHDLRHTFATNCLAAGIPLKVIQKWLGHSEIDTTANIYTHVTDEIHADQARVFDAYQKEKRAS